MSPARSLLNRILRPFGICLGRIISASQMIDGKWVPIAPPTGWRAYRVLPLRQR